MLEALLLGLALATFALPLPPTAQMLLGIFFFLLASPGLYGYLRGAPYVPTGRKIAKTMLAWAAVKRGERVYDLGCGDGRFVFAAAKLGALATGYELSVPAYAIAKIRSVFRKGADIRFRDFWKEDYRDADVIFCFQTVTAMQRFKEIVWPQLKPGCRVVSHAFAMKGIEPKKSDGQALLYIKP